jgi:hypothetical protein
VALSYTTLDRGAHGATKARAREGFATSLRAAIERDFD